MRTFYVVFALIVYSFKVQSSTLCDSDFCVCSLNNKNDLELVAEHADCSYDPSVLQKVYTLPVTIYSLDLSRNNLTNVQPSRILRSKTMAELYLNSNQIREVATKALRLPNLKRLDLSDNDLEALHEDVFQYLRKLEYLNLANNRFTTVDTINFHQLAVLKEIILDNNELGPSLEDNSLFERNGYGLTHKIKSLSIRGINLNCVDDNFFIYAYDLKKLVISKNNLVDIFDVPFTLEYLDLSDNPITQISGEDFSDLVALKVLKLNNLLIKEIPDYAFDALHSLTELELQRNRNLTKFSATAFGQDVLEDADDFTLEKLSLKESRLRTLDSKLEIPFGQLIRLDLQGNFWNCDCNLVWIKKLQIHSDDYEHLRCFTPKPFYNSKIFDLNERYFSCPVSSHHVGAIIAVSSLCILSTSLAIWIFLFLPKYQSRCNFVRNMATPTADYTALPISTTLTGV
ncbi:leucine-rich repeat neuronal protein 3-like [Melitaea cinxia]|uniref:leucine-rich repeat neuronal protein 3-like n=1 Tax=Melitaea cinxia TaxID=113334 RepID=UPI001E271C49|nr:leucine-rich repeat neuronal protein 3-like [Melitaea cinxia]